MIIFRKISWKNFLSTGNHKTEIDFTDSKTNLIVGVNGAGKSTILDALCFSLFGRGFRKINKSQLVNSVNDKDCLVEVEFDISNHKWKVVRGIKPNIFEVYKDDKILNQLYSSTEQQKWLEQNLLKMNYKSFTQIVILGSSTFVPFMELSTANRREVIEDLLDLKIFSSMNGVLKTKMRQIKDDVKVLDLKKQSLNDKIEMQQNFIEELENRGKENIKQKEEKIDELWKLEEELGKKSESLGYKVDDLNKEILKYSESSSKLRKLGTLKGKISQKIKNITDEHKFFSDNTVCPTCTQDIDEKFRLNRIESVQSKAKELQSGYEELKKTIDIEEKRENIFNNLTKEISKITNEISQNNTRISTHQKQIRDLQSEIQKITNQLENKNIEHKKLEEFKNSLITVYDEISLKKDQVQKYEFVHSLLTDAGVKSKIIKKYLPLINQQVNRFLQMMDSYINFILDEEFNETVESPIYEDFSYSSFSEGEKARINLALIFAWREVARMKNSTNCNIILFDEVFDGSLDGTGTEDFLKIIRYVLKDTSVFVISHKLGLEDKFENVYKAEKIKGFSRIVKL